MVNEFSFSFYYDSQNYSMYFSVNGIFSYIAAKVFRPEKLCIVIKDLTDS